MSDETTQTLGDCEPTATAKEVLAAFARELPVVVQGEGARRIKKVARDGTVVGEADAAALLAGLLKAEHISTQVHPGFKTKARILSCAKCHLVRHHKDVGWPPGQRYCDTCRRVACVDCALEIFSSVHLTKPGAPARCRSCIDKRTAARKRSRPKASTRKRPGHGGAVEKLQALTKTCAACGRVWPGLATMCPQCARERERAKQKNWQKSREEGQR